MLAFALAQCGAEGVSGALHIVGNPGGLFHLRRGVVVAVDSPGAPGAEALLLRSGRISEEDWTEALREGAKIRSHRAELVSRGRVGSAELQVVALLAAQDGAFAVAAGSIEEFVVDDGKSIDVLLPVVHGIDAEELLRQTARRLNALASLPFPVSPYRERVVPVRGLDLSKMSLTAGQQEILAHATGRRSARDIAFMVGRSVYPVTVEISRMLNEGLLEIAATRHPPRPPTVVSLRPRNEIPHPDPVPTQDDGLPRREPDADRARASGWLGLSRLFNRIRGEPSPPGLSDTERKHVGP